MALDYSIRHEDSLVRVSVTGSWEYPAVERLWRDIAAACKEHQCLNILGVSDTGQWTRDTAYDYSTIFSAAGITRDHRIAWVQENAEAKEPISLAAAVVRNRQLASARVFDTTAEAKRWLAAPPSEPV